jgi:chaperonin GroES
MQPSTINHQNLPSSFCQLDDAVIHTGITKESLIMRLLFSLTCLLALEGVLGFTSVSTKKSISSQLNLKVDGKTVEKEVKPTNNFILVKKPGAVDMTEGGIILTGKSREKKTEGVVVLVGPGKIHPETGAVIEMPVSAGELVVYGKFDGTEIVIDGVKHNMIQDTDIIVKFKGDKLTIDSAEVIRDGVLVYIEPEDSSSGSGILIAQSKKSERKPSIGKVVKVGPGRLATNGKRMEMEVEVGDFIKFREFASRQVEIEEEEYSVVRMADILAKY